MLSSLPVDIIRMIISFLTKVSLYRVSRFWNHCFWLKYGAFVRLRKIQLSSTLQTQFNMKYLSRLCLEGTCLTTEDVRTLESFPVLRNLTLYCKTSVSLERLTRLRTLKLHGSTDQESIPFPLSLQKLQITTSILPDPIDFHSYTNLTSLQLSNVNTEFLPMTLHSLSFSSITFSTSFLQQNKISIAKILWGVSAHDIQFVASLSSLQILYCYCSYGSLSSLTLLPLSYHASLHTLYIRELENKNLSFLSLLNFLKHLHDCDWLSDIADLVFFSNLITLTFFKCPQIACYDVLTLLPMLQKVTIGLKESTIEQADTFFQTIHPLTISHFEIQSKSRMDNGERVKCKAILQKKSNVHITFSFLGGLSQMERYLLLECLGEGSNGKVHKAQDKESGVYVALKFINVDDLTEGIPAYALREVNILSALHHPHIIGLREVIINGSQVILVLEYMKTNLYSFMQRHPDRLPAVQIKKWFYELLKGVNYMHSQLILHRDLKPENLLLNKTNTLKIADFGLSTQLVSKDQKSSNHHVISLWYKAPELLVPHVNYLYSFEVDMWSCGCIFAEMWTGIPLFCGLNQADQLAVIMEKRGTSWLQERYPEKKWPILLPTPTVEWALVQDENALDLLEQCLQMNPNARISAALALRHPYFAELHGERKP